MPSIQSKRRRMIEVGINRDKALNSISEFAKNVYFFVLPHTDNWGRSEGDAELVKATCMPLSKRPVKKFEDAILEICESGLWTRYKTKKGKLVIQYNEEAFERINSFLIKDRKNPEHPAYESGDEIIGRIIETKPNQPVPKTEEEKLHYTDLILLTKKEYDSLVKDYGEVFIRECIEFLNLWFKEKGEKKYNEYKSHAAMIRRWVKDAVQEKRERKSGTQQSGWKYSQTNKPLKICPYCKKEYPNIESHKLNCVKAPPPASSEFVDSIVNDLRDKFDAKKPLNEKK